jgi:hypothetical protein
MAGFPSVWWLHQHGYKDVVAIMGSDCSEEQAKLILEHVEFDGRIWIMSEYQASKNQLVQERHKLRDEINKLEACRSGWFEPAIRFVKASKQAGFLAEKGSEEEKRDLLKKIGSNLTISDRHLSVVPRGAWQLVVD